MPENFASHIHQYLNPASGLLIQGQWMTGNETLPVFDKISQRLIGSVSIPNPTDIEAAIASAKAAFPILAGMAIHQRAEILERASGLLRDRKEYLAKWIAMESGKALKFARMEVDRAVDTFHLAAQEIGHLHGETMPMDAVKSGSRLVGFWKGRNRWSLLGSMKLRQVVPDY